MADRLGLALVAKRVLAGSSALARAPAAGAKIRGMTAKELVLAMAHDWSEDDAQVALRAVENKHASERRRSEIDEAIIASYTQVPQEDLGASWAVRESIREEPSERAT